MRDSEWETDGPTVVDWALLRRAAADLADELTRERSTAQIAAGASERSRKLRAELRGGFEGLEVDGADDLLERLLQVRVEDFDGRTGWRPFDDARRRLRHAETLGERRETAAAVVELGLDLLGAPVDADTSELGPVEVSAEEIRLVAYEELVEAPSAAPDEPQLPSEQLFD